MTDFVPSIAFGHVVSNIDPVIDRVGKGTSWIRWTARGHRSNGVPFVFTRTDRVSSPFDISIESAIAIDELFWQIGANRFAEVIFDSFDATVKVTDPFRLDTIRRVRVSVNGGPFSTPELLEVAPGDNLVLRVSLRRYQGATHTVDVPLHVPASASGDGSLIVLGGNDVFGTQCDLDPNACPTSFNGFLSQLAAIPRNDQIVASLSLFSEDGGVSGPSVKHQTNTVVTGSVEIPAIVQ
jgi:hypothetical protein